MTTSQDKIKVLYKYYLVHGFEHSVDEIAEDLGISRMTFFNRYGSKENAVRMAHDYWYQDMKKRFQEKQFQCNHSVEEILFFVGEIMNMNRVENVYLQYEREHITVLSPKLPYVSILHSIIETGIQKYQFKEDLDIDTYIRFFLYNVSNRPLMHEKQETVVRYILMPLLNERGMDLLSEVIVTGLIS